MSNEEFACPATGEPLDLCGCDLHARAAEAPPRPKVPPSSTFAPVAASGAGASPPAAPPYSSAGTAAAPTEVATPTAPSFPLVPAAAGAAEALWPEFTERDLPKATAPARASMTTGNAAAGAVGQTSVSSGAPGPAEVVQADLLPKGVRPAADTATTSAAVTTALVSSPPDAAKPAKQLRKVKAVERHMEVVQRLDRRVREALTRIQLATTKAADIDDDSPKPADWTAREFRIAKDARRGPREAPYYLGAAQKGLDTYKRAEAASERDPSPTLNCDIQVYVQQNNYNYETVDGDEK